MTDAVSLVLMDLTGAIRARTDAPLLSVDFARASEQIASLIARAVSEAGLDPARRIGIGVGVTGYFIGDGARLNPPAQLDPWALIPLDIMLAEQLGGPVWVDNDGNVSAVGEAMLGAGRTTGDFAYLYFAAGFGGGVIASGVPMRGSHGNAGEFASTLPDGWPQPNLENLRLYLASHGQPYDNLHAMLAGFDPADPLIDGWLDGMRSVLQPDCFGHLGSARSGPDRFGWPPAARTGRSDHCAHPVHQPRTTRPPSPGAQDYAIGNRSRRRCDRCRHAAAARRLLRLIASAFSIADGNAG